MPTLAQMRADPAYRAEVVPDAQLWFVRELRAALGLPAGSVGTKGDEHHDSGAHRSRRFILRSPLCDNRTYTVTHPDDKLGDEDWTCGIDISAVKQLLITMGQRLDRALRAGLLEEISEWYGNFDGDGRVDGWDNIRDKAASSDSSHLTHHHLTIKRRFGNSMDLMRRLLAILIGDDSMLTEDEKRQLDNADKAIWFGGTSMGAPVAEEDRVSAPDAYGNSVVDQLSELRAAAKRTEEKVDGLALGGIDYDLLADKITARMPTPQTIAEAVVDEDHARSAD